MTSVERFIEGHRAARYAFVLLSFPGVAISDRVRGIWNPAGVEDFRRAMHWAKTGEVPYPADRPRPKPARITTPAERAPLYAAYAAARARGEQIGAQCDDDSIVQYAVNAYETAEMGRLRAQVAEALTVADEMAENSQDPLTTAYANQLRDRVRRAGPATAPHAGEVLDA